MKTADDIDLNQITDETRSREELARDRTALAYERTFLAYIRTSATLFAAGISMVYFFIPIIIQTIGYIFIIISFIVFTFGLIKYRRIRHLSH